MLALLLAAAEPQTAVEAERAFAADAQKIGQWAAFRKWAAGNATMFAPQPVKVQMFLKHRKNPPKSVEWSPAQSYISRDGKVAVNTGPWRLPGGAVGYFTTVWVKQPSSGWKWVVDGSDARRHPGWRLGAEPRTRRAGASPRFPLPPAIVMSSSAHASNVGRSPDGTLSWAWRVDSRGGRSFMAAMWNGRRFETVVNNNVAPTPRVSPR